MDVPDLDEWMPWLLDTTARASKAAGFKVKSAYYFESHLSTRPGDSVTFEDSRVLDNDGAQVCYELNKTRPAAEPPT